MRSFHSVQRRVLVVFLFSSQVILADPFCPPASQILTKWDLWSHGTCLRGANIWQKVIDPNTDGDSLGPGPVGPPLEPQEFVQLASWGANYVNISFPGIYSEEPPYLPNPDVVARLDALIDEAAKANLFVVISLRTGPGRNEGTFNASLNKSVDNNIWKKTEARRAWAQMWQYVAQRYSHTPNVVAYDLMVEPNSNDVWLKIYDSKAFYPGFANSTYDWNPLARQLTEAIRQVDSSTPLMVGAMNYSDVDWLWALGDNGDPKTIYSLHPYVPSEYTNQYPPFAVSYPGVVTDFNGAPVSFDQTWLKATLQPVVDFKTTRNVPIAVNEFGVMRWEPGADKYMADLMSFFETIGVNHAYWLWEVAYPITFDEFNLRHGPDFNNHTDVETSDLINAIQADWKRNGIRPNDVLGHW